MTFRWPIFLGMANEDCAGLERLLGGGQDRDGPLVAEGKLLALIIHTGSWLPRTARSAVQMAGILLCGYDGLPAGGPVPRGSTGPGWISTGRWDRLAQVSQGRGGR